MGRNQHSKDRMYITATEHAVEYGGFKKKREGKLEGSLPFACCALSLLPFETPCCSRDGVLFDSLALLPFVKEHGTSPVTGRSLRVKDVIRLKMAKNADGAWHCPVTCKVFTDHSKVACVAPTGHVYAYEALRELCFKRGSLVDLLDGTTAFAKTDVVVLHDPEDAELCGRRDLSNFQHLKDERSKREAALKRSAPGDHIQTSDGAKAVLAEAKKNVKLADEKRAADERARAEADADPDKPENKGLTAAFLRCRTLGATTNEVLKGNLLTSGATSGSLTSSAIDVNTSAALRPATEDELKTARWKVLRGLGKKGYAQVRTSLGNLNVEVHCDVVPRAAENFLGLCAAGAYDGCPFHRVVRHFVAQGGDPTGTGTGGESLWGGRFADEFDSRLTHDARGVLAYANDGRDRNRSQFYVTFKSAPHLDNKHTVFGKIVGGHDTLAKIESLDVDHNDDHRPRGDGVTILGTTVFVDPTADADVAFEAKLREAIEKRTRPKKAAAAAPEPPRLAASAPRVGPNAPHTASSVGRYLPKRAPPAADDDTDVPDATAKKPRKAQRPMSDFSGW